MRYLLALCLGAATALSAVPSASADTEHCVGHTEYENTVTGLDTTQVANRYDIYGTLLDDSNARFRRGYRTCWAPDERQVVVSFSYDDGGSVDWWVRDIG